MRHKTAVSCSHIIDQAALPMVERAAKLVRLEQVVQQLLPADLGAHCKVMNLKQEILILATTTPAWAGRLRFAAPELIKQLRCQYQLQVHSVESKVIPEADNSRPVKHNSLQISQDSAELLAQTARSINHAPLQEALYRIAARTRSS